MLSKCDFWRGVVLCAAVLSPLPAKAAPARATDSMALVSIVGVELGKHEFVDGIALKTWNLWILAICHIPAGWSVSVDSPPGPTGGINAGGVGVAALGPDDLGELRSVLLVRKADLPTADITGTIDIETRGERSDLIEKLLDISNFVTE